MGENSQDSLINNENIFEIENLNSCGYGCLSCENLGFVEFL